MAAINFGGLASGLDSNAIIDGLMKAERIPLTTLQKRKSSADQAAQIVSGIATKLSSLRSAADALADLTRFSSFTATSSDSALVATTSGASTGGAFTVTVNAVAKEQRTYSNAQTSSTDALNMTGTLAIQVGTGTAVNVDVTASDTLTSIATKINQSGARVSSNILFDGSQYRLVVRGLDSGAANAVTFNETGLSLGLSAPGNTPQAAQDASLTVDGITITRPTNQIAGVIPGVTLAVTKPVSNVEVKVASDPKALEDKINTLVKAYNDVINAGHSATGYGSTKASSPLLSGDSTIRSVMGQISQALHAPVAGATGKYQTLSAIGLESTRDGTLTLNATKLAAALTEDSAAVSRLFVVNTASGMNGLMGNLRGKIDEFTGTDTAILQARIDGIGKLSRRLQDDADALEARIGRTETTLRKQFAALEQRVSAYNSQSSALTGFINNLNTKG